MSTQVTDVIFYDGIISKPQPAQVSRIDDPFLSLSDFRDHYLELGGDVYSIPFTLY